jgi:hypothetical protein
MNKNPRNAGRKQKYAAGAVTKSFRLPADNVQEATRMIYEVLKKFAYQKE